MAARGVVGHTAGARADARVGRRVLLAEVAAIRDELGGEAAPQRREARLLVTAEGLLGVAWSGVRGRGRALGCGRARLGFGLLGLTQLEHTTLREGCQRRTRLAGSHRVDVDTGPAGFDFGRETRVGEEPWLGLGIG